MTKRAKYGCAVAVVLAVSAVVGTSRLAYMGDLRIRDAREAEQYQVTLFEKGKVARTWTARGRVTVRDNWGEDRVFIFTDAQTGMRVDIAADTLIVERIK